MRRKTQIVRVAGLGFLCCLPVTGHAKVDFKTEILPVIEAKCVKCHQATHEENGKQVKPKAELRFDAAWAMLKGGESNRPAIAPGNLAKSYAHEVVTLPKDDDMFMPPKGDPMTAEEIAKLKTWIEEGADFGGWEGNLAGKPADLPSATVKGPPKDREHEKLYKRLSEGLSPASADVIKKVTDGGAQISALMVGGSLLRSDFLTGVSNCNDASVAALSPLKEHIAHLDLARTGITDAALKTVATFSRLTRLDLRHTKVTDAGVEALSASKNLIYLNLFGTEVSDASVPVLAGMKSLKNLYLFETKMTEAGVAKLKAALPAAEIVSDVALPEAPKPQGGQGKGGKKNK